MSRRSFQKIQSTGAHKAFVISSSGFQSGATDFARAHGIALIQLSDEGLSWEARSHFPPQPVPSGEARADLVEN